MEGMGIDPNLLLANMGKDGGDDKTLWLFLLLLMYGGKDGFGGGAGAGNCCPPVTLEQMNDMQNAIQASLNASQNAVTERTLDITRDQAANALRMEGDFNQVQNQIAQNGFANLGGQKDITAAICDCCCKLGIGQKDIENAICSTSAATLNAVNVQGLQTQNAIDRCCCETQNALIQQTCQIEKSICADGDKTRALITDNRMQDLQSQLQICRDENSNLRQTEVLSAQIREQCGSHHFPWWAMGNGNGNGGPPFQAAPKK